MRAYRGVDPTRISDPNIRRAIEEIDPFLRDLGPALASVLPSMTGTSSSLPDTADFLTLTNHASLASERRLTVAAPILAVDGGAGNTFALSISIGAPAFTLGTANADGVSSSLIRTDASIALFDATAPADLAGTAATGSIALAARRDHVHKFPTTLKATANNSTVALTDTATIQTLTASLATLRLSGPTTFEPETTNLTHFGTLTRRWLSGRFGTSGINTTGTLTALGAGTNSFSGPVTMASTLDVSGTLTGDGVIANDFTTQTGDVGAYLRWLDTSAAFYNTVQFTSSAALTADRALTIDMSNADRTIDLQGNPTLADWFNQSVKTTASPTFAGLTVNAFAFTVSGAPTLDNWFDQSVKVAAEPKFASVQVLDAGTAFYLKIASDSLAPGGNFTADRTLTIDMQNAARVLSIRGDSVISQNYSTAGTPQFAGIGLGVAADGTRLLTVNDSASAPALGGAAPIFTDYYGTDSTVAMTKPNAWLFVRMSGSNYKIPLYA